jgi:FdhD protein
MKTADLSGYLIYPNPENPSLTSHVTGRDHTGTEVEVDVVTERGLTVYLNKQEIVTLMTLGDHPEYLALGFLLNQNMLHADDVVTGIDYDEDLEVAIVRTQRETNYEDKLKKKVRTSGCAQGTVFGDIMEKFDTIKLATETRLHTSWLYQLSRQINTTPSIYQKAGAIHGCVLCHQAQPLVYMEDVGRHNAIDKIAGYMFQHNISPEDKCFYTTGRLTSEMVIKTVQMRIPILISRSGFTAWGVDLARKSGLTLIGRAKGRKFVALAGYERLIYDVDTSEIEDESSRESKGAGRKKEGRKNAD